MNQKTKLVIVGIALSAVSIGLYFKLKKPKTTISISKKEKDIKTSVEPIMPEIFPLKSGSRGVEVENLQKFLNQKINAKLVVDGILGRLTIESIKVFQNPFIEFRIVYPSEVYGQVSKNFYKRNIIA